MNQLPFSQALGALKNGKMVRRAHWLPNTWIAVHTPDAKELVRERYLYRQSEVAKVTLYVPSNADLFADDWMLC